MLSFNVQSGIVARVLGGVDVILNSLSRCFLRSNVLEMIANHTIFRVRGHIVNGQEEVLRDLHGGETVSSQNADSGVEVVKSKLTTASSTGKE